MTELNSCLTRFLTDLFSASAAMGLVVLLLTALSFLPTQIVAARWRYAAWLIVALGFLIPFRPASSRFLVTLPTWDRTQPAASGVGTTATETAGSAGSAKTLKTTETAESAESAESAETIAAASFRPLGANLLSNDLLPFEGDASESAEELFTAKPAVTPAPLSAAAPVPLSVAVPAPLSSAAEIKASIGPNAFQDVSRPADGADRPNRRTRRLQQIKSVLPTAAAVWLTGIFILSITEGIRYRRFAKSVRRWEKRVTDPELLALFEQVKGEIGVQKRIGLARTRAVQSPMTYGFFRPTILLPDEADGPIPTDELTFILKHELIHSKRSDVWRRLLIFAAAAIHWFNPLACLMSRMAAWACEESCDETVVRSADEEGRRVYIDAIIGVIRKQEKTKTVLTTDFYRGENNMKKRLLSIMDSDGGRHGAPVVVGILALTLSTGFLFGPIDASASSDSPAAEGTSDSVEDSMPAAVISPETEEGQPSASVSSDPPAVEGTSDSVEDSMLGVRVRSEELGVAEGTLGSVEDSMPAAEGTLGSVEPSMPAAVISPETEVGQPSASASSDPPAPEGTSDSVEPSMLKPVLNDDGLVDVVQETSVVFSGSVVISGLHDIDDLQFFANTILNARLARCVDAPDYVFQIVSEEPIDVFQTVSEEPIDSDRGLWRLNWNIKVTLLPADRFDFQSIPFVELLIKTFNNYSHPRSLQEFPLPLGDLPRVGDDLSFRSEPISKPVSSFEWSFYNIAEFAPRDDRRLADLLKVEFARFFEVETAKNIIIRFDEKRLQLFAPAQAETATIRVFRDVERLFGAAAETAERGNSQPGPDDAIVPAVDKSPLMFDWFIFDVNSVFGDDPDESEQELFDDMLTNLMEQNYNDQDGCCQIIMSEKRLAVFCPAEFEPQIINLIHKFNSPQVVHPQIVPASPPQPGPVPVQQD